MSIRLFSKCGMTLMEILLVVILIAMTSAGIYGALSNGIKVWQRNQQLVIEEDIAIFFDKLTRDLCNTFVYSKFEFKGGRQKMRFPAIVRTLADRRSGRSPGEYIDQMGQVEYYYDGLKDIIYRRQANYSQALNNQFASERVLAKGIEDVKFRYFYYTDNGEVFSPEILDAYHPSRIEVEVFFSDAKGRRSMQKLIDVPLGS